VKGRQGRLARLLPVLRRGALARWVSWNPRERSDPFRTLVSCILSTRTQDKTTDAASARLFRLARTPRALTALPEKRLVRAIFPVGFYWQKARALRKTARLIAERNHGCVPRSLEGLLELPGVGRKVANLVLGRAFGIPAICVDTHVHRISNRLGLVRTRTPEETERALARVLPRKLWTEWNGLLVNWGQTVCRPVGPKCGTCGLRSDCARIGVE